MLICYKCGSQTERASNTRPGEGYCETCLKVLKTRMRRKTSRKMMDEAADMCGLVKVRGALGGIYYE